MREARNEGFPRFFLFRRTKPRLFPVYSYEKRMKARARGIREGRESAMTIEELIDLYGDGILRLCVLYLGDRQLAEDAFQETLIKAWKKWDEFRGESSVKTWLMRIAINTCRDVLRSGWFRTMRRSQPVETLFDLAAEGDLQEETAVRDAVLRLPGIYREVILLHCDQDMKIREIAKALGVSENTVSTRLRRARALIEKELKEEIDE